MTRLFILLNVAVLAVLFAAWFIHGAVSRRRAEADRARVFEEAHGGGARLVASELDAGPPEDRKQTLNRLRKRFDYPVDILPLADLPSSIRRRISSGDDVVYFHPEGKREVVVAALPTGGEVVRLGPFVDYGLKGIEDSIGGWMRLTADKLDSAHNSGRPDQRQAVLEELQKRFDFPIDLASREELPDRTKERLADGEDVVFYPVGPEGNLRWFAATPLSDGSEIVRFGPFPSFEQIEQKAATTTLALVLLPAALIIVLLLRPIARQLRQVENAAKAIAAGDLSARVDESRVRSAKPLAQAFNNMAGRTETLVRTQRELLQAVSHELRTPLSRMRFAIDLIDTAKDDVERKQRLESLDAATEELDELVGELLRYVRMETLEPQLSREQLAVGDALEVVISKYAALYPAIDFSVCDGRMGSGVHKAELNVFADRLGFERVLGNLLSNAGRFANSQVKISAQSNDAATIVDVDDDGVGIPQLDRQRVFEPFVRLKDVVKGNGRGVGLGLALVKRIVTQHGGSAEVLQSPLGGCRIRTTWPADPAGQPAAQADQPAMSE